MTQTDRSQSEQIAYLEGQLQTADARFARRMEEEHRSLVAKIEELQQDLVEAVRTDQPYLGLADTEMLIRELIVRFKLADLSEWSGPTGPRTLVNLDRCIALAEMLGGLSAPEREYRTVDEQ